MLFLYSFNVSESHHKTVIITNLFIMIIKYYLKHFLNLE